MGLFRWLLGREDKLNYGHLKKVLLDTELSITLCIIMFSSYPKIYTDSVLYQWAEVMKKKYPYISPNEIEYYALEVMKAVGIFRGDDVNFPTVGNC